MKKMLVLAMLGAMVGSMGAMVSAEDSYVIGYAQRATDVAYTIHMMDDNVAYAGRKLPGCNFPDDRCAG